MKRYFTLPLFFLAFTSFSQKEIRCQPDTLNLVLAYETDGQFYIGEHKIKSAELVRFNGNKITVQDYQKGIFIIPEKNSVEYNSIRTCGLLPNGDSLLLMKKKILDTLQSKKFVKTNKTFYGGKKSENVSVSFSYKIVEMKLVVVPAGSVSRQLINMDRKTKKEPSSVNLKCPLFLVSEILSLKPLK